MNWVKGIKSVLAQENKILDQALDIHIQYHLVEGSSKKKDILIYIFNSKT